MIDLNKWIAGLAMAAGSNAGGSKEPALAAGTRDARQLVLLGIVLQALHILFGVTAIIGVLVTQTRAHVIQDSIYESHILWQFITFWIGSAGYAIGFYSWATYGNPWLVLFILLVVLYRLVISAIYWKAAKAMNRLFI